MEEVMKALGLPGPYPQDVDLQTLMVSAMRVQDAIAISAAIIAIGASSDPTRYADAFRKLVDAAVGADGAPPEVANLLRLLTDTRLASIEGSLRL